jgi:hypothetical protein
MPNTEMSSSASQILCKPVMKKRCSLLLLIYSAVSPLGSNNVHSLSLCPLLFCFVHFCLFRVQLLILVLHGEFRESTPQSLEFHVNYDTDPNTNIPALRVKYLEIYNLNSVQALLSGNRKVIPVHNARFTDYHNILYYIYTGQLNLRYPPSGTYKDSSRPTSAITSGLGLQNPLQSSMQASMTTTTITTTTSYSAYNSWEVSISFPRAANPNEIYRLAGMMGLAELQARAYHYLMSTTSVDNIFDRYFDPYCKAASHAPVRGIYQQFLARNWDKIRTSGQWAALLRRYRATQRDDEAEYLLEVMCEILNAVTWDPKISNFLTKAH